MKIPKCNLTRQVHKVLNTVQLRKKKKKNCEVTITKTYQSFLAVHVKNSTVSHLKWERKIKVQITSKSYSYGRHSMGVDQKQNIYCYYHSHSFGVCISAFLMLSNF